MDNSLPCAYGDLSKTIFEGFYDSVTPIYNDSLKVDIEYIKA